MMALSEYTAKKFNKLYTLMIKSVNNNIEAIFKRVNFVQMPSYILIWHVETKRNPSLK